MGKKIFERYLGARGLLPKCLGFLGALFGEIARGFFVFNDAEFQPRFGDAVQAKNLNRHRRPGFLQPFAFLADEGADTPIAGAADYNIAAPKRAFAYQ